MRLFFRYASTAAQRTTVGASAPSAKRQAVIRPSSNSTKAAAFGYRNSHRLASAQLAEKLFRCAQ